jgi:hypothetical protein
MVAGAFLVNHTEEPKSTLGCIGNVHALGGLRPPPSCDRVKGERAFQLHLMKRCWKLVFLILMIAVESLGGADCSRQ